MVASEDTPGNGHDSDGRDSEASPEPHNLDGETVEFSFRVPREWADAVDEEAIRRSRPGSISDRSKVLREIVADELVVEEDTGEVSLGE